VRQDRTNHLHRKVFHPFRASLLYLPHPFPNSLWFLCWLSLPGTRSCNQKGGACGTLVLGIQCTWPTALGDNTLNLHSSFSKLSSLA
jgi:hypothetical protein